MGPFSPAHGLVGRHSSNANDIRTAAAGRRREHAASGNAPDGRAASASGTLPRVGKDIWSPLPLSTRGAAGLRERHSSERSGSQRTGRSARRRSWYTRSQPPHMADDLRPPPKHLPPQHDHQPDGLATRAPARSTPPEPVFHRHMSAWALSRSSGHPEQFALPRQAGTLAQGRCVSRAALRCRRMSAQTVHEQLSRCGCRGCR